MSIANGSTYVPTLDEIDTLFSDDKWRTPLEVRMYFGLPRSRFTPQSHQVATILHHSGFDRRRRGPVWEYRPAR